uniref:NR LBD domain-containing protein n=1 Tax=Meloidogyne hapla TaxID=6305 RepID=A0A1I8BXI4_MELHA
MLEQETLADCVILTTMYIVSSLQYPSNFNKRYHCAKTYGLSKLEKACLKFIFANREEFMISKEWKEFKSVNGVLAFKLLENAMRGEGELSLIELLFREFWMSEYIE